MSVRQAILALLAEQSMHGYQVRQEFERRTGGTWPLNIGQVYTTIQRLVRDGLVESVPSEPASDAAPYVERLRLTTAGREEVAAWWATPVGRGAPARDELVIKLTLAVTAPGVDARHVIQRQRTETMRALRDYTRLKVRRPEDRPEDDGAGDTREDLAWSLVLDNLIFAAEAEVRWLDHVEARLARAAGASSSAAETGPAEPAADPDPASAAGPEQTARR
jgi:DNA-binding PadR family transcriptional regulator